MIEIARKVAFLRKIHLFHGLEEAELTAVAERIIEDQRPAGQELFKAGTRGDGFFLIFSGKVAITRTVKGSQENLATLVAGDYFGEEALFTNKLRSASATTLADSLLFVITYDLFAELLKRYPRLRPNFQISIDSRRLARRLHFKWLRTDEGEVIYFLARKHYVLLVQSLTGPVASLLLPVFFFLYAAYLWVSGDPAQRHVPYFPLIAGALLLIAILLWMVWNAIDWGNDYYVVTNQRAVWVEKIIGVYDSTQEAPLQTILSVGVETDALGRAMDYGNVVVRTFVGKIPFNHVSHPYHAAHLIEEHWQRSKEYSVSAEKEAMKEAIRQRLGLTRRVKLAPAEPRLPEKTAFQRVYKPGLLQILGTNIFKLRIEGGETVTYRKHWFVLLEQVWKPTAFLLLLIAFFFFHLIKLIAAPGQAVIQQVGGHWQIDTILVSLPLIGLPFLIWWIYEYVDWRNDIFQVTPDQILDIDRRPFGTEERRAAPLENILSIQSKRLGLLGYLFNFGNVHIVVGGTQLVFEDVYDPASVQQDIDNRRLARITKKREAEVASERTRMAEWLATYHENAEELRRLQEESDSENKTG